MPQKATSALTTWERLCFLATNRIPRRWATLLIGWLSRQRQPLIRGPCTAAWRCFAGDLALHEARQARFSTMQECFIRELKPGARPIDQKPASLISPCDGIVMARGQVADGMLVQAKGFPFRLAELLADAGLASAYAGGRYVTLRLRANMYHRFHAPDDARLRCLRYIAGDTWNVNPIALQCVERLYCRNARAVLPLHARHLAQPLLLIPVAAVGVASIRIHGLPETFGLRYRGPSKLCCKQDYRRGEEIGYFEQGSTVIVLAGPGVALAEGVTPGATMRVGQRLLSRQEDTASVDPRNAKSSC